MLSPIIFLRIFGPLEVEHFAACPVPHTTSAGGQIHLQKRDRCVSPSVDPHKGVCQPTLEYGRRTLTQVQNQQANIVLVAPL